MGYQFFLPMVLRWRASRAEAPLLKMAAGLYMYMTNRNTLKNQFATVPQYADKLSVYVEPTWE